MRDEVGNQVMRKLKIWNGRDWESRGHIYVAAYSVRDAVDVANEAYRKVKGYTDRPDIRPFTANEVRVYWHKGCWGRSMDGIEPERGVWWQEKPYSGDKPVRVI